MGGVLRAHVLSPSASLYSSKDHCWIPWQGLQAWAALSWGSHPYSEDGGNVGISGPEQGQILS